MTVFRRLNNAPWYWRWPIKSGIFLFTLLAVCFPYPSRLVSHVKHWLDPNALIEPDSAALIPLANELEKTMPEGLRPEEALHRVEQFVYEKIPYAWDWDTWGTADYLPTVEEVIHMGREDCDGRAVVAASLLRRLGFEAQLVTNFSHVWVKTQHGETMGPGKSTVIVATDDGLELRLGGLAELPKAMAYGVGVFPAEREFIVLAVLWMLLMRPGDGMVRWIIGFSCLTAGWVLLRKGSGDYYSPNLWLQLGGCAVWTLGLVIMVWWSRGTGQIREPG